MKKILMLGAALLALQAIPALAATEGTTPAEGGKEHHGKMLEEADTNKDGAISKDEFTTSTQKRSEKRFDEMDANHDGKITKEELKAHHEAMKAKWEAHKANKTAPSEPKKAE